MITATKRDAAFLIFGGFFRRMLWRKQLWLDMHSDGGGSAALQCGAVVSGHTAMGDEAEGGKARKSVALSLDGAGAWCLSYDLLTTFAIWRNVS